MHSMCETEASVLALDLQVLISLGLSVGGARLLMADANGSVLCWMLLDGTSLRHEQLQLWSGG